MQQNCTKEIYPIKFKGNISLSSKAFKLVFAELKFFLAKRSIKDIFLLGKLCA
jgi:hypothetical protein